MKRWHLFAIFLFLFVVLTVLTSLLVHAQETPRVIPITAKRFTFSPAEVTLKKGETVKLELKTEDVTHGFFMKALHIDATLEPGKTAEVTVTPETAGKFLTICDHFCGAQHGNMHMTIVVTE